MHRFTIIGLRALRSDQYSVRQYSILPQYMLPSMLHRIVVIVEQRTGALVAVLALHAAIANVRRVRLASVTSSAVLLAPNSARHALRHHSQPRDGDVVLE